MKISATTRLAVVLLAAALGMSQTARLANAQAGLREALERLDVNENRVIEPEEITPLSRPYLERITRKRRMSLDRSIEIDRLQEAARIYYALKNGVSGEDVRPEGESTIKPFAPQEDSPIVPGFGLGQVKYPIVRADLDEAERTIRRYDRNGDGFVDPAEAAVSRWTHRNPFEMDLNKDDRLSRMELSQRYARRRLLSDASDEFFKKARRTRGATLRTAVNDDRKKEDGSTWWRRGGSDFWLTASLMGRFDANRNGRLERSEAESLGIPTARIDIDRNGDVSREELHSYMTEMQSQSGGAAEGLPAWFYELDSNRDGQVAMDEFTEEWTETKFVEFRSLDLDRDGLLTSAEVAESKSAVGGRYNNTAAEVLPPRKTIISEIEVNEDFVIGDLNLQISITHSNTSFLDAYLTGPDGQRIELFTGVGGSGDHFDQTIFDDQARDPINKARPPFKGVFLPEAIIKRQPSLSHFNGKSVKGVWQLVIRGTRNERFGMLHSWSLMASPNDGGVAGLLPAENAPDIIRQGGEGDRRDLRGSRDGGRGEGRESGRPKSDGSERKKERYDGRQDDKQYRKDDKQFNKDDKQFNKDDRQFRKEANPYGKEANPYGKDDKDGKAYRKEDKQLRKELKQSGNSGRKERTRDDDERREEARRAKERLTREYRERMNRERIDREKK